MSENDRTRDIEMVFVLGTGRCGSTLVHEVLAKHPSFGFVSNVDDRFKAGELKGRWNNALYRRIPPRFTQKGRFRYAPSEAYNVLDRTVSPALSTPFRDLVADDVTPWLTSRVKGFFESRAEAQDKSIFLHKFTGWPRAGFFQKIFPNARFINVIRDGRAVANSFLQMPWWGGYRGLSDWGWGPLPEVYEKKWEASGQSFVLLAGLEWNLLMDAFEAAKAAIPSQQWMDVRYEDFVAEPKKQTEEMLRFAGADWSSTFDEEFARFTFSTSRRDAFRKDLDPGQVQMLTDALSEHLERYGYSAG